MSKAHTTLSVDYNLLNEAKECNINMSQMLEDSIRAKVAYIKKDLTGINIQILEKEFETESNKLMKLQIKVNQLKETIDKYKSGKLQEEQNQLEKQKEEIIKKKTCCVCGSLIDGTKKTHRTKVEGSFMCGNCYLDLDGETSRKWF